MFLIAYLLRTVLLSTSSLYVDFESFETGLLQPLLKRPDADSLPINPSAIVITAIYALMLGLISWAPLNLIFRQGPSLLRAVKDNDFERLIQTAVLKRSPRSVTTDNKKVYVGFVVSTSNPAHARKTLGLLPLVSGYRGGDGRVKFTTYYSAVYESIERDSKGPLSHLSPDDFEIVLPIEKIQSANMFDFVAYEEFNRERGNKKKRRVNTRQK